jgi:predicted nucleotidyltransferase component of viral defense system
VNNSPFFDQTKLMLEILPLVMSEDCFALKGGTAINFFHRDMPRLSVDIDLTFLPLKNRETTLNEISNALERISKRTIRQFPNYKIHKNVLKGANPYVFKIQVDNGEIQIKIEPNLILRGCCYKPIKQSMSKAACNLFEEEISCMVMSSEDLYGGKICAALDRQHPRDLFDAKVLFENEGLTDKIMESFIIYLSSNNRPISELLSPNMIDIKTPFKSEFTGMAQTPVSFEELLEVRTKLIDSVNAALTNDHKQFLISLKEGTPKFELLKVANVHKFPAIQWKLANIQKMDKKKHQAALNKLQRVLNG